MRKKQTEHFLSLIIPVFRQEKTIAQNLKKVKNALDGIRYDYEIIAVVDGMVDHSLSRLNKLKATIPQLRTISYKANQGKSWALRLGLNKAKGDYAMFIDAGEEIDPSGISMLIEHMEWYDADIIVGSKRHPASYINYSPLRRLLSDGYYILVKILFGIKVHDTQAGIKIFRRDVFQKVLPRLMEKRFAGELEMLVVAKTLGYKRIFEAPIKLDYTLSPITSAANLKSIWSILKDTLAIFYRKNILRHYDRPHN